MRKKVLGLVVGLVAGFLLLGAAPASAQYLINIEGNVLNADGTGGAAGLTVEVWEWDSWSESRTFIITYTTTNSAGAYSVWAYNSSGSTFWVEVIPNASYPCIEATWNPIIIYAPYSGWDSYPPDVNAHTHSGNPYSNCH